MTKKHSFGAAVWLISLIIYFAIFLITIYAASSLGTLRGSTSTSYTDLLGNIVSTDYCDSPRYKYDATSSDIIEYGNFNSHNLECLESNGVRSEGICSNIEGCTWENVTSTVWFFFEVTDSASCIGTINASYYGVNTSTNVLGQEIIEKHTNTNYVITPCNSPAVVNNNTLCNLFSCTWTTEAPEYKEQNIGELTAKLFLFSYEFSEDNSIINFLVTLFFVYLPLIMLIISLYYVLNPLN